MCENSQQTVGANTKGADPSCELSVWQTMSESLVYVNDALSCSVNCDDDDTTLASFRKDVLDDQVDDIIHFPYKFTRPVNDKRIVVGVKQEAVIKVSRCFIDTEANEKAIYLIREESKCEIKTPEKLESASSQRKETVRMENSADKADTGETPSKQRKLSRQPSILQFCAQPSSHKLPKSDPYSAAKARNIRIYKESEINESTGLVQVYRKFWNAKAEEICSSHSLRSFKAGEIQGAINVAWTLEKTRHLKQEVQEVNMEIGQQCSHAVVKKIQSSVKTIEKNTQRVENAHESLSNTHKELADARFELFKSTNSSQRKKAIEKASKKESELEVNLTELRKAQDALRKSIHTKRKLIDSLNVEETEQKEEDELDSLEESHSP